jgi:hypothetical protein
MTQSNDRDVKIRKIFTRYEASPTHWEKVMGPFELLAIMYNTDIPSIGMPETKELLEKQRGEWDWS